MRRSLRLLFSTSFRDAYDECVASGKLRPDPRQLGAVQLLDGLEKSIDEYCSESGEEGEVNANKGNGWRWSPRLVFGSSWWGNAAGDWKKSEANVAKVPKGLYLYGGVGCGKTMLMDMLFERSKILKKKREHFYHFMNDFHKRALRVRESGDQTGDAVLTVADEISSETILLFVDEFQVTDIADAVVLRRLFTRLFQNGLIFLSTSNRPPDDLYKNGLQRSLFLPFIPLIKTKCFIYDMESTADYRLLGTPASELYRIPEKDQKLSDLDLDLDLAFSKMTGGELQQSTSIKVLGRRFEIARATKKGFAFFEFQELCDQPLSAADYIAICRNFHTLFIRGIPRTALISNRNVARRFIMLIDQMYEHRVKLVCTAVGSPATLFDNESVGRDNPAASDEIFSADRAVSRLTEMQSEDYLKQPWRPI